MIQIQRPLVFASLSSMRSSDPETPLYTVKLRYDRNGSLIEGTLLEEQPIL